MAKKKRSSPFGAKAEFVRSMPPGMPAAQIVEEAKKQGLTLTPGHIYNIRAAEKRKAAKVADGSESTVVAAPRRGRPAASAASGNNGSAKLEAELRRIIAELGLARARAVMSSVEDAFSGRS